MAMCHDRVRELPVGPLMPMTGTDRNAATWMAEPAGAAPEAEVRV
jgi:hypothetical protein